MQLRLICIKLLKAFECTMEVSIPWLGIKILLSAFSHLAFTHNLPAKHTAGFSYENLQKSARARVFKNSRRTNDHNNNKRSLGNILNSSLIEKDPTSILSLIYERN